MKKRKNRKEKIITALKNFSKLTPPKILVFLSISLFVVIINLNFTRLDNDFWFLINTGKYILNNGFPTIEPFTIHADLHFIVQQWLTDVIFYLVYSNFNIYGMFIFMSIMNIIITYLIYKICMLVSNNKVKISVIITILVDLIFSISFVTTRPQIFDVLILLTELYLLESYLKKDNKKYLLGLPIVSLLMVNLHSSLWTMIFVFLLPYYAEIILKFKKEKNKLKSLIPITLIMFLVGLINPYGIESINYLFTSYGIEVINNYVTEMLPITLPNHLILFIYIFIVLISFYYNKGNNKLRYFFFTLGTCYLGLSHYKGYLYFIVASVISLSYNFKDVFKEELSNYDLGSYKKYLIILFLIYSAGIYTGFFYIVDIEERARPYLYEVADYLDENATKDIKLYTSYETGSYLEYRGYKCYIDPRAEVFLKANNKKEDILDEYYQLQTEDYDYEAFLIKYNFDYLVVTESDKLYNYMDKTNYEMVYEKLTKTPFQESKVNIRIYKRMSVIE